jgi:lactate dehydrogenase-like 2-hydroxyacid dehydrogenase
LNEADVVSIHLVLSDRSRNTVGKAEIDAMKPGATLVNTSRGPLVDEAALLEALEAGRIKAGLDVFDIESRCYRQIIHFATHPTRCLRRISAMSSKRLMAGSTATSSTTSSHGATARRYAFFNQQWE